MFWHALCFKSGMNLKRIITCLALAGSLLGAESALANPIQTITTTYAGSANFGLGGVGYDSGSIAPNPSNTPSVLVGVGIGGDSFSSADHSYDFSKTGSFNTWCVDIYHWVSGSQVTYNVQTGDDLATVLSTLRTGTPVGATRVSQLIQLANEVYKSVDTKDESAAFQLAVWAITYGMPDQISHHYTINSSDANFMVDAGTVNSVYGQLANTWLASLGSAPNTGNYKLTYLNDGTLNNTQDMIVFTEVPEPATLGLLAFGLLGLGMRKRRKKA